jgi:hypothetical protein
MMIKLACALGAAALAVSFTLSNYFACSEAPEITASVSESVAAGGDANGSALKSNEEKIEETAEATPVEASSTDASALSAVASVAAIPVELTEAATVVVPAQKSDDNEDLAITASITSIISKIKPSSNDVATSRASKAQATFFAESDIAEWKLIFDAYPAPDVAEDEPAPISNSTIGSVDPTPLEIMETMTAAVSVQKTESQDVEITGPAWEPAVAEPDTAIENLE